ncbi:O-methyltransferase MdmC-like [Mercenaria mercenaria]|uniref:O-methyltransferase MdmC-like n=1 Tax=Mercenaria mercenaria TaxID=6596 RepID=UPI00234FAA7E|nr:O-methyltransferase MdmC-like [Mercenaria mercenaria]XP_045199970.2 O-methyltransferase MdmC-like [Mercenaria mercenaria]XP_045199978.2 O-methyltransferase MdmC-like [Mercenaria mercenaria]XP_053381221.1 O-methyltransferase MdmC-like [Mercenaria mercenaria]
MAKVIWDPAIGELYKIKELCAERGVDEDIQNRLSDAITTAEAREAYCESVSSDPSEVLTAIQSETLVFPFEEAYKDGKTKLKLFSGMLSGHFFGKFLQSIVSMSKAKRVLEIGTFTGYATLAFAEALPEDGTVTTLDIEPYLDEVAKNAFAKSRHGKKIAIRIGDAKETLLKLSEEKAQYDVVFIDANKAGYVNYFKTVMEKDLLAKGGTIVFDNALWYGSAYDDKSAQENGHEIRKFNEYLKSRDDMFRVLVPIRDGALIVRRKEDVFL